MNMHACDFSMARMAVSANLCHGLYPVKNKTQPNPNRSKIYKKKTKKENNKIDPDIKLVPKKLGTVLIKYAQTTLTFYLWQLYILD